MSDTLEYYNEKLLQKCIIDKLEYSKILAHLKVLLIRVSSFNELIFNSPCFFNKKNFLEILDAVRSMLINNHAMLKDLLQEESKGNIETPYGLKRIEEDYQELFKHIEEIKEQVESDNIDALSNTR